MMVCLTVSLANPMETESSEAMVGEVHDLVGDEHFLKKYYKRLAYHPVPVYRPVYHPPPMYYPVPVYHKKYHKG
jgi:hypothetical protein